MLILPKKRNKPFARFNSREFIKLMGPHCIDYTKGEILKFQREQRLNLLYERAEEYGLTVVAPKDARKPFPMDGCLLKVVDFDQSEMGILRLLEFRMEFGGEKDEDARIVVA